MPSKRISPKDEMYGVLIDPEFYGILKEEGHDTSRRADGTYWDEYAQRLWIAYQESKSKSPQKANEEEPDYHVMADKHLKSLCKQMKNIWEECAASAMNKNIDDK